MLVQKVNIYSLCNIDDDLFDIDHSSELQIKTMFDVHKVKTSLNLYGGTVLHSLNNISLYLKNINHLIYLNFIPKDELFCLQIYAVVIDKVILFLPFDNYELECFKELFFNTRINKILIYSTGITETNKYILREFVKKVKIKLCYYRKSMPNNIVCLKSLLWSIRSDISSVSGKNIFYNRVCDLKF